MEFVLAFLLFFGGLALGSNTADKGESESPSTAALSNVAEVPDSHQPAPAASQSDSSLCYTGRGTIYRDLTEPYLGQANPWESQSHCVGDCPDE